MVKIFLVDDDEEILKIYSRRIEKSKKLKDAFEKINVSTFQRYDAFVEAVENQAPDMVLLDSRMDPGTEEDIGVKSLPELRERMPFTHIIIITGYGNSRLGFEAAKSGAFSFYDKGKLTDQWEELEDDIIRGVEVVRERREKTKQLSQVFRRKDGK